MAANTSYSYTVRAEDAAGNLSDPSTAASATTPASTILTIAPEADSRVQESAPTTNYATSTLRTDGGTNLDTDSFLRFNVSGVSGTVASAKLRIFAYTSHRGRPGRVHDQPDLERDRGQLEQPAGAHQRRRRRQGRDRHEHLGRVRRHAVRDRQRHVQLQPRDNGQ